MLEAVALAGVVVSAANAALALRSPYGGSAALLAFTWVLYKSLYAVGQTFLSFQWDILLLEANALAVLLPLSAFEPRPVRVDLGQTLRDFARVEVDGALAEKVLAPAS